MSGTTRDDGRAGSGRRARRARLAPLAGVILSILSHGAIAASLWFRGGAEEAVLAPRLAGVRDAEPLRIRWVPAGSPLPPPPIPPPRAESILAPLSPELPAAPVALSERAALPDPVPPSPAIADAGTPAPAPPAESRDSPDPPLPPSRPTSQVAARTGPVLLGRVEPAYPRRCLEDRHEGAVELLLRVDAEGRVTDVTVVGRSPCRELDEAARKAALRLRYEPAREAGRSVAGLARLTVRFVLE